MSMPRFYFPVPHPDTKLSEAERIAMMRRCFDSLSQFAKNAGISTDSEWYEGNLAAIHQAYRR